jgi:WD40 repeat protein
VEKDVPRGHEREVVSVDFSSRDTNILATGSLDRTVRIWDLREGGRSKVVARFTNDIVRVEFSPDGRFLAVGAFHVFISDVTTWRQVQLPEAGADVVDLRFSRDGKYLISENPTVHVHEVGSWRLEKTVLSGGATTDARIAASEDGLLAVGRDIGTHLYETGTWRVLRILEDTTRQQPQALAFARDGRLVVANGDASLCIWDLNRSGLPPRLTGQVGRVSALAVSPNSKTLAVADMSGAIRLRNMSTGKELFSLEGHETAVNALCFSPDGAVLASGGSDGTARLWSTASLNEAGRQPPP